MFFDLAWWQWALVGVGVILTYLVYIFFVFDSIDRWNRRKIRSNKWLEGALLVTVLPALGILKAIGEVKKVFGWNT